MNLYQICGFLKKNQMSCTDMSKWGYSGTVQILQDSHMAQGQASVVSSSVASNELRFSNNANAWEHILSNESI